jgi:hypothetical protein
VNHSDVTEVNPMFTNLGKLFWKQAAERAVKTAIQVFVALLSVGNIGILDAPWSAALSTAAMAAFLSVLTSVISEPVGHRQTPSVITNPPLESDNRLHDLNHADRTVHSA